MLSIASGGGAVAAKPGQVVLAAENSGRRAGIDVLVLPPGTFRLTDSGERSWYRQSLRRGGSARGLGAP